MEPFRKIDVYKNSDASVLNILAQYIFKYAPIIGVTFLEMDESTLSCDKHQLVIIENEVGVRIEVEEKRVDPQGQ